MKKKTKTQNTKTQKHKNRKHRPMNQGIVLIKPHANNKEFLQECRDHLKLAGVYVTNDFPVICTKEMADNHYSNIARYASSMPKKSSIIALETYRKNNPTLSAEEICVQWRKGLQLTVDKDFHIANIGDAWVANGFYAYMQEDFDNREAHVLVVRFDFPFSKFKSDVIGCTNASKAHTNTLRGLYHAKYCTPSTDMCRNGVHASTSALEGFRDCILWGKIAIDHTSLFKKMEKKNFLRKYMTYYRTQAGPAREIEEKYGEMETSDILESQMN